MANERRLNKSASRTLRHGGGTTVTSAASAQGSVGSGSSSRSGSSSGSGGTVSAVSGGKKQSRQYRLPPHPPVPPAQASLLQSQRVPASGVAFPSARQVGYESPHVSNGNGRYYASAGRGGGGGGGVGGGEAGLATTSTARGAADGLASTAAVTVTAADATQGSTETVVPSADPDAMEAKKGLNKWGAFDSLSGSGTGTFGFGPLLFHHVDETPRDPYDTTNMMLNDPISFNPMSAISWARLDESPESIDELEGDHSSTAQQSDTAPSSARAAAGARGSSSRHDGGTTGRAGYVDSPASTAASPRHGSGASYASDVSGSRTSSVAGSSVGNISRTFSDTSLVSPDTERSSAPVPSAFTTPPSSRTPHPPPGQQQQKQQGGSQAEFPGQYRAQQPPQQKQQVYQTQNARFPTEEELAAHYRAEHAFTCTWASCPAVSFTSRNALDWHVNAEHYLVCPVPGCCGATFGSKRALEGHLKVSRNCHTDSSI
ncbi:hypothetical protein KVR01_013807 [Diaporthe batatas]|uniref:uncharacterized protein n=1 Tax=Diaporthe batatas TaxID=748121 RepID=UPI001D042538|nr:uncharacterized protein KVR01_013807 [Diaporthe batatas]KAG8156355.1 hypothetical protein KVR01_013807 [Diaporthe batatas]